MEGKPQDFMTVGLIHFMAYPDAAQGEGRFLETMESLCADSYFGAVEVTSVRDKETRRKAAAMAKASGKRVAFGAQPILLGGKLDLGATDPDRRRAAVDAVCRAVDEAIEWDASGVAVLSGPDPGPDKRAEATAYLTASLKTVCEYSRRRGGPPILLEVFDRASFGKNALIGPHAEAAVVARHVGAYFPSFGLIVDLSHLPLLDETAEGALKLAARRLRHAHMGNCVKRFPQHPAYGDNHPMFGIAEGENGVPELTWFLRALMEAGFIAKDKRNIVSFEVKPFGGQSSEEVIRNAKETLDAAWAAL